MSLRTDQTIFDIWDSMPLEFKQFISLVKRGDSSYCWSLKNKYHISTKEQLTNMVNIDEIFEVLHTLKRLFEVELIRVDVKSFVVNHKKSKRRFEI